MFPRYFSYGQIPQVPNLNSLLGMNFTVPLNSTTVSPSQDMSTLLLSNQTGFATPSLTPSSSYLSPSQGQLLGGLSGSSTINPLAAQYSLSSVLPFINPALLLHHSACDIAATSSESQDVHTIVRAPVLYGNDSSNQVSQVSTVASKSPPDQIVASYAAAARAAAIAYQQPLSNAAEVFLSVAASAAGTLANSSGHAVTVAKNRAPQRRTPASCGSTVLSASTVGSNIKSTSSAKSTEGGKFQPSWNSTWTRMVDRQADVVVYISPGGMRLKSLEDVHAYLRFGLSAERLAAISKDCINASFCFDATRETRLVSAPDDSLFVFPEDGNEVGSKAVAHEAAGAGGVPSERSPSNLRTPETPIKTAFVDNTNEETPMSSPTNSATKASITPVATKRLASTPSSNLLVESAELPPPPTTTASPKYDEDVIETKRLKTELALPSISTMDPIPPFHSDPSSTVAAALTTPTFVARDMTRPGGGTAVVPSVVASVLPPLASSATSTNYGLVQQLAILQQHQQQQALIASATLIQPAEAAHRQFLEQYKQQQAAAVALLLQQQQHQLQLQQYLQTMYACALQQQSNQNNN